MEKVFDYLDVNYFFSQRGRNLESKEISLKQRILYFILGLILSVSITIIRYITGPKFEIDQFYLIPIIIVTWYAGRNTGIIISTISILLWIVFDFFTMQSLALGLTLGLNLIFKLLIFFLIIQLIHRTRELINSLQDLSETDPLTRISNRRSFLVFANRELYRAKRYGSLLTLIYIDLDNFKNVNDPLGHSIGDSLLKKVANILKETTRKTDVVARMGGDEFCLLLTETDMESSIKVYRKIENKIRQMMLENNWQVTLSAGVVTFQDKPDDVKEMISVTDEIMYKIKRTGKDNFGTRVFKKDVSDIQTEADFVKEKIN